MRLVLAAVILTLIAGCGFHLRGGDTADIKNLTITVSANGQSVSPLIYQSFKNDLEREGVTARQKMQISLDNATFRKRVIVLDANARPAEQVLIFQMNYSMQLDNQKSHVESISVERNYLFNSDVIASTDEFEKSLQQNLLFEAKQKLRQRINRLMTQTHR